MTAINTFRFSDHELRPACEDDYAIAAEWSAQDPDRDHRQSPRWWLEQTPSRDSYLFSDGHGPLLFFKTIACSRPGANMETVRTVELHMQFAPQGNEYRIGIGLMAGLPWLVRVLRQSQVEELFFRSRSERLIAFSIRRLGFTERFRDENGVELSKSLR